MTTLAPVRRIAFVVLVVLLSGCGGSSKPGPGKVLYESGDWAVVVDGSTARAFHRVGGRWQPDTAGRVKVSILGPRGTAATTPQVAVELSANAPLVESALWVDGVELNEKGGGLGPDRGTIYGAPGAPLASGKHLAVGYARTANHAAAVAWLFRVP